MKTKRIVLFLIMVLMLAVSLACQRSVPGSAPAATKASTEGEATVTAGVASQFEIFLTQTAIAQGAAAVTPIPGGVNPVPTEGQPAVVPQVPGNATAVAPIVPSLPTAVIPIPTQGPAPATYTLKSNEFPFCIARRFNVDPAELLRLNGLNSYSIYNAGMTLRIPQTGNRFPGNRALLPHPGVYTAGPGDTIFSIACAFGDVDPMVIAAVNGIAAPYKLAAGQVLQIP